ncbi:hypothetical protein FRC09_012497 [Ceratobasidium sp. 395]|nr:hypothetical protein FRC09_012497 [Ceratobasidium sp. 395]
MSDSQDRRMADLFEIELRRKAELDPSNAWELVWFLRLPLETRCSYMRILEARIDQEPTRRFLCRQSCYRQRNWRDPVPDVMFMQTVDQPSRPWASLGQRQRRKPITYGRSRPPRSREPSSTVPGQKAVPASSAPPIAPKRAYTPRPDPPDPYANLPRPSTPPLLRQTLHDNLELHTRAMGYSPETMDHLCYSPRAPVTPPEPVQYEPFPLKPPGPPGPLMFEGKKIPKLTAYLVAAGRHYIAPWQGYDMDEAARDISILESQAPGLLDQFMKILFPPGGQTPKILPETVLDLMHGWSIVPMAWRFGEMPAPIYSLCGCKGIHPAY